MSLRKESLLMIFLFLIQISFSQNQLGNISVVDLSDNYPLEKLSLQDYVTVEYVPLETTDDILLSENARLSAVTSCYILVYELQLGDIYLFDRNTGKLCYHFNHKGQGGMEYAWIKNGTVFDEKAGEIYVCSQYIQVYSLDGKYKRTLKVNGFDHDMKIFNYDEKYLLIYDDVIVEPNRSSKVLERPYRLISKKDGSTIYRLNISFPKRNTSTIIQYENNNSWRPITFYYPYNARFGEDFMIMDISSDTLYHLSSSKNLLTPVFKRVPSVFTSEPRNIWTPYLTTDKFILFGTYIIDINNQGRSSEYMYEFKTGKIKRILIVDNELNFGLSGPKGWNYGSNAAISKNMVAELVNAPAMIEAYKNKRLLGNGNEVAKYLKDDDNQIVRILKFK